MTDSESNPDGYVRIPSSVLPAVQLRHLMSERDPTIAVPGELSAQPSLTGYTEWVGTWNDSTITVGWDWGVVQGVIVVLDPAEIRTNIRLVFEDRQTASRALARIHLHEWIESLPWRQIAIADLLRDDAGSK
jgi:hypothetical protein